MRTSFVELAVMENKTLQKLLYLWFAILLSGCVNSPSVSHLGSFSSPELIITVNNVGVDENNQVSSFSIPNDIVYVVSKWSNLQGKTLNYLCKMYDGEGQLAFTMGGRILPDNPTYYYQSNYGALSGVDKAGKWRIEIYVDDVLVASRNLIGLK